MKNLDELQFNVDLLRDSIHALKTIDHMLSSYEDGKFILFVTILKTTTDLSTALRNISLDVHFIKFLQIYYSSMYEKARSYLSYDITLPYDSADIFKIPGEGIFF